MGKIQDEAGLAWYEGRLLVVKFEAGKAGQKTTQVFSSVAHCIGIMQKMVMAPVQPGSEKFEGLSRGKQLGRGQPVQ